MAMTPTGFGLRRHDQHRRKDDAQSYHLRNNPQHEYRSPTGKRKLKTTKGAPPNIASIASNSSKLRQLFRAVAVSYMHRIHRIGKMVTQKVLRGDVIFFRAKILCEKYLDKRQAVGQHVSLRK
jgi:hypothetical protein